MNGSPPFSNVEDKGKLQGQTTMRTVDNNKDNILQQGRQTGTTNKANERGANKQG